MREQFGVSCGWERALFFIFTFIFGRATRLGERSCAVISFLSHLPRNETTAFLLGLDVFRLRRLATALGIVAALASQARVQGPCGLLRPVRSPAVPLIPWGADTLASSLITFTLAIVEDQHPFARDVIAGEIHAVFLQGVIARVPPIRWNSPHRPSTGDWPSPALHFVPGVSISQTLHFIQLLHFPLTPLPIGLLHWIHRVARLELAVRPAALVVRHVVATAAGISAPVGRASFVFVMTTSYPPWATGMPAAIQIPVRCSSFVFGLPALRGPQTR